MMILLLSSCGDKNITPPNEEELITTLEVRLFPLAGPHATFVFRDLDGDGGAPPVIETDTLLAGGNYVGSLFLANESVFPAVNITPEVVGEGEEHQVFYSFNDLDATFAYTDQDADGNPVGIAFSLTVGTAGEGAMTIILRHLPDKFASGVRLGNIANAGGETDIQVSFPVVVR